LPSSAVRLKGNIIMTVFKKTYRVDEEVNKKIKKLLRTYGAKSENELFEMVVKDIYEIKQSKALVPYEELDKKDVELKKAFFELGKLKNAVEEREKMINELKKEVKERNKELEKEKNKGFWARLFGK